MTKPTRKQALLNDYAAKCAELFGIEQRRGYVQLFLKGA